MPSVHAPGRRWPTGIGKIRDVQRRAGEDDAVLQAIRATVVGSGTRACNGIRQDRRHVIESLTSRHSDSKPNRYRDFKNINRR